jgi:hypothetical protein
MRCYTLLLAAILLASATLGCGNRGPARFDVSGKVTFHGKPVPIGRIVFLPDKEKGNAGPTGYANIQDGAYDTRNHGKGTCGGPQTAVISGYDGKSVPGIEVNAGKPLFTEYRVNVDLPRETGSKDFDVPASVR